MEDKIRKRLLGYFTEMRAWEIACAERDARCASGNMSYREAQAIGEEEYASIFSKHCSRTQCSPRDFHYAEPPDYDPQNEVIERIDPIGGDKAEVHTKEVAGFQERHIYRVVRENGEWLLCEKLLVDVDGELLPANL